MLKNKLQRETFNNNNNIKHQRRKDTDRQTGGQTDRWTVRPRRLWTRWPLPVSELLLLLPAGSDTAESCWSPSTQESVTRRNCPVNTPHTHEQAHVTTHTHQCGHTDLQQLVQVLVRVQMFQGLRCSSSPVHAAVLLRQNVHRLLHQTHFSFNVTPSC